MAAVRLAYGGPNVEMMKLWSDIVLAEGDEVVGVIM